MLDIIKGWLAYQFMNNSTTTLIFLGIVVLTACILIWMQFKKDEFDLRALICEMRGEKAVPATDKTLLVGSWIISSYLTIEHYSEGALTAYLTLWVLNGGVAVLRKNAAATAVKEGVL